MSIKTPLAGLQIREDGCSSLDSIINQIGTSSLVVVYGSFGGFTALYVCQRMNGQNCETLALAVASGFMTVFGTLVASGAIPINVRDEGNHTRPMLDRIHDYLEEHGIQYQAITNSTEALLPLYGQGERKPLSVTSLHGVKHFNNTGVNMDFYDFGNGEGHVHLPYDVYEERNETHIHSRLGKRSSPAYGFKLSFTTRLQSQLTKSHQADMSTKLASWWAESADEGTGLHDTIGFVETGNVANFYYRLIPETVDFGLNYESVDSCGQMAGYL